MMNLFLHFMSSFASAKTGLGLAGSLYHRGVYTRGNGAKRYLFRMAKIGGKCCDNDAFGRVYNNLLLHEYIYYFTPVHF